MGATGLDRSGSIQTQVEVLLERVFEPQCTDHEAVLHVFRLSSVNLIMGSDVEKNDLPFCDPEQQRQPITVGETDGLHSL